MRLLREIYSNQLKHPHIAEVRESFLSTVGTFISVSHLAEDNLMNYRDKLSSMSVKEISEIMFQICLGLDYTHSKGLIHRDISPDNILVYSDGTFKICDFGLAAYGSNSHISAGKEAYMAVEVRK